MTDEALFPQVFFFRLLSSHFPSKLPNPYLYDALLLANFFFHLSGLLNPKPKQFFLKKHENIYKPSGELIL